MARKLILLIDREASIRTILQACLNRLGGWDVLPVSSLQEGLEVLPHRKADAILLDVPMLETDGFALIREFSNHPSTQSIPILLIATKASWFSRQQLQEAGIVGAISKPFNPITLPRQIAELLDWTSG